MMNCVDLMGGKSRLRLKQKSRTGGKNPERLNLILCLTHRTRNLKGTVSDVTSILS
jgi:hypothetical protein